MTSTELWSQSFGDEYTDRNRTQTIDARDLLWRNLIPSGVGSVLEVGANVGLNLQAIGQHHDVELYGTEPNEYAREELCTVISPTHVTSDYADKLSFPDGVADLVLTMGVLIHVPPDKLIKSMQEIYRCSRRYILCAEYFAPSEEMVPYRGRLNALWRRDYGSLYLDNFSDLHCKVAFFAWKRTSGLDNLTFWIFEKGTRWN